MKSRLESEEYFTKDINDKELLINANLCKPNPKEGSVIPSNIKSNQPQNVYISTNIDEFESGLDEGKVKFELNGQQITPTIQSNPEISTKVTATYQAPQQVGTYPVSILEVSDKAENTNNGKQIGTITVTESPDKNPCNPDESFDIFDSSLPANTVRALEQPKLPS